MDSSDYQDVEIINISRKEGTKKKKQSKKPTKACNLMFDKQNNQSKENIFPQDTMDLKFSASSCLQGSQSSCGTASSQMITTSMLGSQISSQRTHQNRQSQSKDLKASTDLEYSKEQTGKF